jgi:hypothetical protein
VSAYGSATSAIMEITTMITAPVISRVTSTLP